MTFHNISCFKNFCCLAGSCPDTCCAGWEIDLDADTLARYAALPGPLGEEVRSRIQTDDGYTFFGLEHGRCPFLNEQKLCRLILAQGDDVLSVTCREHPRFVEEYGDLQETCLSISCPEAARLLLEEPIELTEQYMPENPENDDELDETYLSELLEYRAGLFALVCTPAPLTELFAGIVGTISSASFSPDLPGFWAAMGEMEFTSDRLPDLLRRVSPDWDSGLFNKVSEQGARLLFYFLYRYVLRAVWDGFLREKVLFSVYAVAAILRLASGFDGIEAENIHSAAVLFSREVEHSDENLDRLYAFLDSLPL